MAVTVPIFAKFTHAWLLVKKKKTGTSYAEFHENPTNSSVADTGSHKKTEGRADVRMWCPNAATFMRGYKLHTRHVACHA